MLRRQPAELRIVLQGPLLFSCGHILVPTQPVACVALLLPSALRLARRLLLMAWRALWGLVSLTRSVVRIFLRRAGRGESKHSGYACRCQPFRDMSPSFQISRLLFPQFVPCNDLLPTPPSRVCRDVVLDRQLIEQFKIGVELVVLVQGLQVAHRSAGLDLLDNPIVPPVVDSATAGEE